MENKISLRNYLAIIYLIKKSNDTAYIKKIINEIFGLKEDLNDFFYSDLISEIKTSKYMSLFFTFKNRNIYELMSFMYYDCEDISLIQEYLTPKQYLESSKNRVNMIEAALKGIKQSNDNFDFVSNINWRLKKEARTDDLEYQEIAYKMYLTIGLDSSLELLSGKFGKVNYEAIHYLFKNIDLTKDKNERKNEIFNDFLFGDKKAKDNTIRQMLDLSCPMLFHNFSYFYNHLDYYVETLGEKLPRNKVELLLKDRVVSYDVRTPEIRRDIITDMVSSYYNKYGIEETEEEIISKNLEVYGDRLKNKNYSSIPYIEKFEQDGLTFEMIPLNDPKNLVMGYRAGNCFRINGDARILFNQFLVNPHMRLVSVSSKDQKDFAMMLIMRNGNVLISQGIETSNRASNEYKGKKLYDICAKGLTNIMDYMNENNDEVVASIIGRTNENVSNYNNQILPFLVNPILENGNNYYNGIDNYQVLVKLKDGSSLNDIKLFTPDIPYQDLRDDILYWDENHTENFFEIEKIITSLEFLRFQESLEMNDHKFCFRDSNKIYHKVYCNKDWCIILYKDGDILSYINSNDDRAFSELEEKRQILEKESNILKRRKVKK